MAVGKLFTISPTPTVQLSCKVGMGVSCLSWYEHDFLTLALREHSGTDPEVGGFS